MRSKPADIAALQAAVQDILKKHPAIEDAAKVFADLLERNSDLRYTLALAFVRTAAPKTQASRRKAGRHRRPVNKVPTAAQKQGALRAAHRYTSDIFARKLRGGSTLGETHVQELRAIAQSSAETAISFLARGYDDAVDLFACTMLANHCVTADPLALVKDIVNAKTAAAIYDQAKISAAEALRDGGAKMAAELLSQATARSQQLSIGS